MTTQTTTQKSSITERLRADLHVGLISKTILLSRLRLFNIKHI